MIRGVTPAKVPAIKGLVLREFIRWYEATRGREVALRARDALPLELRAHLDPERELFGLLAGSWYPASVASGLLESITSGLGPLQRTAMLREGIEHAVGTTLTGVYRVLFKTLVTPERHAKYAQKIWDNYYNTGIVQGAMLADNRSEQWVKDWPGHHPVLCELSIWSLTVFHQHMGCTNVKVNRSRCVLDGQHSTRGGVRRPSSTQMRAVGAMMGEGQPAQIPPLAPVESHGEACRFLIQWDSC